MDTNQNTDCDYYIKELENEKKEKFYVFFVNKDIPLTDEILQEMAKYEIVEFCNLFDQNVGVLPTRLQSLKFGNYFNQPVNNLPSRLQSLTLEWQFNQPIDNLPSGLQSLTFGNEFNQLVDNLPLGLQSLTLDKNLINQWIFYQSD